jgi:hypothetical protein
MAKMRTLTAVVPDPMNGDISEYSFYFQLKVPMEVGDLLVL